MKTKSKTRKTKVSKVSASRKNKPSVAVTSLASEPQSFRLKRILVTTDFSEESERALPYAAAFAEQFEGEIDLLNVLEPPPRFVGLESLTLLQSGDAAVGRVYSGLHKLAAKAFKPKIRVTTHSRTGKPFREIVKAAQDLKADLIVMATHGYSGLKHSFLGSTTERVMQHASCPVLVVRGVEDKFRDGRKKTEATQRIVLTTDLSNNSMKGFPLARSLAIGLGDRLTLMHVVEKFPIDAILGQELTRDMSEPLMERARAELTELATAWSKRDGLRADVVVRFGKPLDEITRGAKDLDASLIVMATHGYTGLKHLYLGSVAERVVRHAHCPVLVVREIKR